jgi:hypothetical protein
VVARSLNRLPCCFLAAGLLVWRESGESSKVKKAN